MQILLFLSYSHCEYYLRVYMLVHHMCGARGRISTNLVSKVLAQICTGKGSSRLGLHPGFWLAPHRRRQTVFQLSAAPTAFSDTNSDAPCLARVWFGVWPDTKPNTNPNAPVWFGVRLVFGPAAGRGAVSGPVSGPTKHQQNGAFGLASGDQTPNQTPRLVGVWLVFGQTPIQTGCPFRVCFVFWARV